jgi:hypothetical protein
MRRKLLLAAAAGVLLAAGSAGPALAAGSTGPAELAGIHTVAASPAPPGSLAGPPVTIEAWGRPGRGAAFTVRLPAEPPR